MKQVHKVDLRSQATAYGPGAVVFGMLFVGVGSFFAAMGFELIPMLGKANAPLWVIGMVGLAFAMAGLMVVVQGLRGWANKRRQARLHEIGRSTPSAADYPWDPRGIEDRPLGRVLNSATFVVFMVVFMAPFNWWAFISPHGNWFVKIITGFFDLIALLVLATAIRRTIEALRYGKSRLRFREFPFRPGRPLHVALDSPRVSRFDATLRFIEERFETVRSGSKKQTKLISYEHFATKKSFEAPEGVGEVEMAFDLPDHSEWVTRLSGKPVRYWEILIESDQPGVDFRTTFPLPVYRS